jgi:beta-galactosidase
VRELPCRLELAHPQLWSLDHPALHRMITLVRSGGQVVDRYETTFGVRSVRFDPDHGFFLNGQRVELMGVNVHQDHAGVGVALPDALQEYRIRRLKDFGANAYRCAHHPPTPELLEACDRLGLLVLDENRLMGSNPEQLNPLERMIRRDRNHPSVILWSIGNEEWEIEGNIKGARIASTMQAFVQRLDPSRRVTAAISGGWGGTSTVIDVVGYNYINQSNPDEQHAKFPQQPGVGTEETTTQGTRGIYVDDRAKAHLSPQERGDSGGNCEKGWKYYAARPFLAGLFYWTGFDYRGEPTPFGWPAIQSQMGLLDTCGFRKDSSYYLEAWWTQRPVLHLATHWNWPGREGQEVKVVCYSNHEAVELLLNGASLGRKDMPRNGHLEWTVPYQPGTLEARGFRDGKVVGTARVETTGAATQLTLTPDRTQIRDDGRDVAVFTVAAQDANGRLVPTAGPLVEFVVTGGRVLGVGNGDPSCHEPDGFVETVTPVALEKWQGRIAPAGTDAPSTSAEFKPLNVLGNWLAPRPKDGEVYDLDAVVVAPQVPADATVELLLPSFGAKTSVWLNGKLLGRDIESAKTGPSFTLAAGQLVTGENRIQLVVTPLADNQNHIPEVTRIGSLCVHTPAPPARRSLFNGLAQVLVQSAGHGEPLRLTARSAGLAGAEATVGVTR